LIDWIKASGVGDIASIAGVVISIIGFIFTLIGVSRSRKAAEDARDQIHLFENIVDFSTAITTLEEIKRLHRQGNAWPILPDRYANIRKLLIQLRSSTTRMNDEQKIVIQSALANLAEIEKQVERALADKTELKANRLNLIISSDVDGLLTVLNQLKNQPTGVPL
jgi:hypothetical protein